MKNIVFVTILILSVSFIFIKGEQDIKNALKSYVAVGFENAQKNISRDDLAALNFFVDNQKEKSIESIIEFFINDELIDKINLSIGSGKISVISPTEKTEEFIKEYNQKEFKYSVKINWNKRGEKIEKDIVISN